MKRYEYMKIALTDIPKEFIDAYDLNSKALNGYVYLEIQRGMYGLPQAGRIAYDLLKKRLAKHGYFETKAPGLWKHTLALSCFH